MILIFTLYCRYICTYAATRGAIFSQSIYFPLKSNSDCPFLTVHLHVHYIRHGFEKAAYINVIRHPVEWVTSKFYFRTFGWEGKPGCRRRCQESRNPKKGSKSGSERVGRVFWPQLARLYAEIVGNLFHQHPSM